MPIVNNSTEVVLAIKASNEASPVIKQVASDVQALETSNANLNASAEIADQGFSALGLTFGQLSVVMSALTASAGVMVGAFQLAELGAGNERLAESGRQLARSYGESMDEIVSKVRDASLGTVSDMDIIASANKAMMLGVSGSAEQLANLMEIAAFRGRAMGISTTEAFERIANGIGKLSIQRLDDLGIILDSKNVYDSYAKSIGKSADELTRSEKIQAVLNNTLEEGNAMLEAAGGLVEDNAAQYEQLNARVENYKNSVAASVNEAITPSIRAFLDLSDAMDQASEATGRTDARSRLYLGVMQLQVEQERAAAEAARMHSDAMEIYGARVTTVTQVEQEAIEISGEAVKGAMQVHDTYEKLGDKLSDLADEHKTLLDKKQELIEQGWWPESEKIKAVNDKLAENEQKQKDVTLAMQGTLSQMLLNTAAAGLDAEGQLALARATGQIDEATYAALSAQADLKKQYDDGKITAEEYAKKTVLLRDAVKTLESKKITITADAIFNQINKIMTSYQYIKSDGGPTLNTSGKRGYASGTQGWETVPSGYPNDTYPIMLSSGERFAVIPSGVSAAPSASGVSGGGVTLQIVYAPGISFGDESEAEQRMWPTVLKLMQQAKANGQI